MGNIQYIKKVRLTDSSFDYKQAVMSRPAYITLKHVHVSM